VTAFQKVPISLLVLLKSKAGIFHFWKIPMPRRVTIGKPVVEEFLNLLEIIQFELFDGY